MFSTGRRQVLFFIIGLEVVLLSVCGFLYWESRSTIVPHLFVPDFAIRRVKSDSRTCDKGGGDCRDLLVTLVNRLNRRVTLMGGTRGCTPEGGCFEVLDLPLVVEPRGLCRFRIRVQWTKQPADVLPVRVFTDLSLTEFLDLDVQPNSVRIHTKQ